MGALLSQLNDLLAAGTEATVSAVSDALSANNAALFNYLPAGIKKQLLAERDPHGNVQVSLIETEKLLAELVGHELDRLRRAGKYAGAFAYQTFFLGYEGRCGIPSPFDNAYCYALGFNASVLLAHGQTGMLSSVTNLGAPVEAWTCCGVPLTVLMNIERRHGKDKPVIRKWLVDLAGAPFRAFAEKRELWALTDCFRVPGPIQMDTTGARQRKADGTHVDPLCFTLALELAERARVAAGGHAHGASASSAAGAHSGDLAGYTALCEGILDTGAASVSAKDVRRLALFRAGHGIGDDEHDAVLRRAGITADDWRAIISRTRREEAAAASSRA